MDPTFGVTAARGFSSRLRIRLLVSALIVQGFCGAGVPAAAQEDARTRQLRLLCAQLSGDLSEPGGMAAFRRCLSTRDPVGEIRRDNNIGAARPMQMDRPAAAPPKQFGRDSRRALANGVRRFGTLDGRVFYVVDKDAKLWRWSEETKVARAVAEKVADFELVDGATILVLGVDGRLWRKVGDAAGALVDAKVAGFQAMGGLVYVRGTDGKLWREVGNAGSRSLVDQQTDSFQAIDASVVYVLGSDGKLWRETNNYGTRNEVAGSTLSFQYISPDSTTYVLARDGTLWRQKGDKGKPEQVDHDVQAFQAMDGHLVYVLGRDGRLWRDAGNRDQAELVDGELLVSAGRAAFQAIDAQHVYVLSNALQLWAETMPPGG